MLVFSIASAPAALQRDLPPYVKHSCIEFLGNLNMEPGHTEDEHSLLGKATQALQRTDQACGLTSKAMSMWQEN